MNRIFINTKKYLVPGTWGELTKTQALQVLQLFSQQMSNEQLRYCLLLVLLQVKQSLRKQWLFMFRIPNNELRKALPLVDFLFKNPDFTIQRMPSITVKGMKLYGPSDKLGTSSFIEYIKAEHYYLQYMKSQHFNDLNYLIATLYRPSKGLVARMSEQLGFAEISADKRLRFNDDTLDERAALVATLPAHFKSIILEYFHACRGWLGSSGVYPDLFIQDETKSKGEGKQTEWLIILDDLAGKSFGNFMETAHTNLHLVFMNLNKTINRNLQKTE